MKTVTLTHSMPPAEVNLNALSGRLRYARRRARMTQGQAAERSGVTRQAVGSHESGRARPNESAIDRYAEIYEVDPEWLRNGGKDDRPLGATLESPKKEALPPKTEPFPGDPLPADWPGSRAEAADRFTCPRCNTPSFRYAELVQHLEDGECGEPCTGDRAERLARAGDSDELGYFDAIETLQRWIQDYEAIYDSTPATEEEKRDLYLRVTYTIRRQLQRLLAVGVDGYTPPPGSTFKRPL